MKVKGGLGLVQIGLVRTQDLYYHSSTVVQNVVQKKVSFNPGRFCEQKVDKGLVCQCCGM